MEMNKFLLPLLVLSFFHFSHGNGSPSSQTSLKDSLRNFTYEDCRKFIGTDGFRSKEEFIQIFYNAYYSGNVKNIIVKQDVISRTGSEIRTMFPVKNCQSIILKGRMLQLKFDKPQRVSVPGSFGQAHLLMSEVITFELYNDSVNTRLLRFQIVDGYIRLRVSGLLKLFSPSISNMDGSELFYYSDSKKRISIIGLNDIKKIPHDLLHVSGDGSNIKIDIVTPEFKDKDEFVIQNNSVKFFNMQFFLLGGDSIKFNDGKWVKDTLSNRRFRLTISELQKEFVKKSVFQNGIVLTKTAQYMLEQRRLSMSLGFGSPGK